MIADEERTFGQLLELRDRTPSSPNSSELTTGWLRYLLSPTSSPRPLGFAGGFPRVAMIDATQWLDCADRLAMLTRDEARRIAVNIAKPESCNDENNGPDQQDKNRKASRQVQALCISQTCSQ
jgi:hypothetical protein